MNTATLPPTPINRPLRIVHVIRSLDPARGGPPSVCSRLIQEQVALGHESMAVVEPSLSSWFTNFIPGRKASSSRSTWGNSVRQADVVHLHGVWDLVLSVAAAIARHNRVPYVVMPHGMLDPWCMTQKPWKKRLALALDTRKLLTRAAALHLLYHEEGEYAATAGARVPGWIIPNGVSLSEIGMTPPASEFRNTVPGLEDRPYVLFLGRMHHKKGLDILAKALAIVAPRFPDVRLVVAGPEDGAGGEFHELIAALGLGPRVAVVGPLYGGAKWAALSGASCFCLPSRQEGFSVAVLEALACRVPVVISDACHFPEVSAAGAGVVVPLAPDAVAEGLASVLNDPSRAVTMGMAGRALIEQKYTWEQIARQTVGMYHSILTDRRQ